VGRTASPVFWERAAAGLAVAVFDATVVCAGDAGPPVAGLLAVTCGSASIIAHPPPGERLFAAVFPLVLGAVVFFFVSGSGASDQPPTEPIPVPPLEPPPIDAPDIAISARTEPVPTKPVTLTVTTAMNSIRFMIMTTSPAELAWAEVYRIAERKLTDPTIARQIGGAPSA
jgi:hypothetical protein